MNDFLVNKPGCFTKAEHLMIPQHARPGASMLEKLDLDPGISSMVLQQHENFDGTGYPNNLSGEQIHPGTRFIRIVNTSDAITSYRGYRTVQTAGKALSIIEPEAKNSDPQLIEIFRKMRIHTKR
jgi:HD-GYP domain-containing protein (c-di-GMP phosphodiesterase class II)